MGETESERERLAVFFRHEMIRLFPLFLSPPVFSSSYLFSSSETNVYTWGRGDKGQLGHGNRRECRRPTVVEALRKVHMHHALSQSFSLSLCLSLSLLCFLSFSRIFFVSSHILSPMPWFSLGEYHQHIQWGGAYGSTQ
jgi:hypothetical protein